jgi:hypothetical protein
VKKLLDTAGVPNELERGISDEGDPWCIFCMVTGEVFIHLSRFDGRYILDSPNLQHPITGADFTDLIAAFSDGALRRTPQMQKDGGRVIRLERNGKVFLHPATLLAALIWSIYLNSEELVMLAPENGTDSDLALDEEAIALLNEAALSPISGAEAAGAAHFMDTTALPGQSVALRVAAETDNPREVAGFRDMAGKAAVFAAPTPIALGLSAVAIAFGLVNDSIFDAFPVAESVTAETDTALADAETVAAERETDTPSRQASFDLVAMVHDAFDHAAPEQMATPDAFYAEAVVDSKALNTISLPVLAQPVQTDLAPELTASDFQGSWADVIVADMQTADAIPQEERADVNADDSDTGFREFSGLETYFGDSFQTYEVAGMTIKATFDISSLSTSLQSFLFSADGQAAVPDSDQLLSDSDADADLSGSLDNDTDISDGFRLTSQPSEPDEPSNYMGLVDANAWLLFEHFLKRSEDGTDEFDAFEDETTGDETFLNRKAFLETPLETIELSWTRPDGTTVVVVGVQEDFEAFGLSVA